MQQNIIISLLLISCALSLSVPSCSTQQPEQKSKQVKKSIYAVAMLPTPVLNTPDFHSVFGGIDGKTLKLNKKKLIEEVEFIALPNTVFVIEDVIKKDRHEIFRVKTADYPYPTQKGYYVDSRFVKKITDKPPERKKLLPDKETIIRRLISSKRALYIWGGNYINGIPEMLEFYKPEADLPVDIKDRWMLKGTDCSGLLYEATDGYTPRNTDSLLYFGSAVNIKGMTASEIAEKLKPLDIIVYKRHLLIVLNSKEVIESTITDGVRIRSLSDALKTITRKMAPVNDYDSKGSSDRFVVRRWYP